eukprot:TRINITY_DN5091_c1_g1_i2.p1 TRINITY_DN5091_c1_g1~~TRINITY_DN5091_c1_g1_i2.p1  ORF type:complete len:253 (+),score=-22.22 TRINITY_DN5091_c1_g1_i2:284-1042(+)
MNIWITPATSIKLLGLTFQHNLLWDTHIQNVCAKTKQKLCVLTKLSHIKHGWIYNFIRFVALQQILPCLFYQACIWQSVRGKEKLLKQLQQILRQCALSITQMNRGVSIDILLLSAGLFSPQIYIEREVFRFFFILLLKSHYSIEQFQSSNEMSLIYKSYQQIKLHEEFNIENIITYKLPYKQIINDVCIRLQQQQLDNSTDFDMHAPTCLSDFLLSSFFKECISSLCRFSQKQLLQLFKRSLLSTSINVLF